MSTYGGYIDRLSRKVESRLADIEAIFNFDLGAEFEIAMCLLLEDILPARYGVCRGFVVAENGQSAGDDLIIYDRMTSPTLRATGGLQYSIKEQIPVDAVFAYLECKHSIRDNTTFSTAIDQVRKVKKLLLSRPELINLEFEANGPVYNGKTRDWPRNYPRRKNQPYCAVFARHFEPKASGSTVSDEVTPDLMVLGRDHIATHSVLLGPDGIKSALFFDPHYGAGLRIEDANGSAFGLGIVSLLQAINWIQLVPIDWGSTLNAGFTSVMFGRSHPGS